MIRLENHHVGDHFLVHYPQGTDKIREVILKRIDYDGRRRPYYIFETKGGFEFSYNQDDFNLHLFGGGQLSYDERGYFFRLNDPNKTVEDEIREAIEENDRLGIVEIPLGSFPFEKILSRKEFNNLMEELDKITDAHRETATNDYAAEEDVFDNFKRLGKRLEISPRKVLMQYMLKHMDSIERYVNGKASLREPITGRIEDCINYLKLLWAWIKFEGK